MIGSTISLQKCHYYRQDVAITSRRKTLRRFKALSREECLRCLAESKIFVTLNFRDSFGTPKEISTGFPHGYFSQWRTIALYRVKDVRLGSTQHRGGVGRSDPTGECRLDDRVNRVTGTRGSRVGTLVVRWPGTAEFGSRGASCWTNAAPRWSAGTRRRWWAPGGRTM